MNIKEYLPTIRATIIAVLAISAVIFLIGLFFYVRELILSHYGRSFTANSKYVGTGAAFRAANLSIAGLQSAANPYLSAFRGRFAGTGLDEAFPASGTALMHPMPQNAKVITVPMVAAKAWTMVQARRAADELTPANANADLATLVADPANVDSAVSAVLNAFSTGAFTLSAARYQPTYCCSVATTCPLGYARC